MSIKHVFLGGDCGRTTWRKDIAIPALEKAGISYYDPQYPEGGWHVIPNIVEIEAKAKAEAKQILVVISGETRATASIMEATEWVLSGNFVHLVINDVPEGTVIDGQEVRGRDLRDANRSRAYLRDLVARRRPSLPVHKTVEDAVEAVIGIARYLT